MTQRLIPSLSRRLALASQILLLAGIGLAGTVALETEQSTVKASEAGAGQVIAIVALPMALRGRSFMEG